MTQRYTDTAAMFSRFFFLGSRQTKIGIMRTARLIRFNMTLHAASFISASFQLKMVEYMFAFFIKIGGNRHQVSVGHHKARVFQSFHMV